MDVKVQARGPNGDLLLKRTFRVEYRRAADGTVEISGVAADRSVLTISIDDAALVDIPDEERVELLRDRVAAAEERVLARNAL
jgi:hypothetical protein